MCFCVNDRRRCRLVAQTSALLVKTSGRHFEHLLNIATGLSYCENKKGELFLKHSVIAFLMCVRVYYIYCVSIFSVLLCNMIQ